MPDDSPSPQPGGDDSGPSLLSRLSLRPPHRDDHPNPHYRSSVRGRSPLPTPSTVAHKLWRVLGVQSHVGLTVLLIPVLALIYYLHSVGVEHGWLALFAGLVGASYAVYYLVPPRESKHVIARLENLYHAGRFAVVSSGIAVLTILSTLALVSGLLAEQYFPVAVAETSVTIATVGFILGLASSYILVRVLVARALPVQSDAPLIDRLVNMSSAVELAFILAAVGSPAFVYAAAFFWDRPALMTISTRINHDGAGLLLLGLTFVYTAAVTRL